jgi:hypothetical protein
MDHRARQHPNTRPEEVRFDPLVSLVSSEVVGGVLLSADHHQILEQFRSTNQQSRTVMRCHRNFRIYRPQDPVHKVDHAIRLRIQTRSSIFLAQF